MDKSVPSSAPGVTTRHLDLDAARALTQRETAGLPSDMDGDEGQSVGGWTNSIAGVDQGPSNGVNAGGSPASNATQIRPGGGRTP